MYLKVVKQPLSSSNSINLIIVVVVEFEAGFYRPRLAYAYYVEVRDCTL